MVGGARNNFDLEFEVVEYCICSPALQHKNKLGFCQRSIACNIRIKVCAACITTEVTIIILREQRIGKSNAVTASKRGTAAHLLDVHGVGFSRNPMQPTHSNYDIGSAS